LGGIAPILLTIAIADTSLIVEYINKFRAENQTASIWMLGYIIKIVILFIIGALWALSDSEISSPIKEFQIGIIAPANITAMINAANLDKNRGPDQSAYNFNISIISKAKAQQTQKPIIKPNTFEIFHYRCFL
jgi:hypothetical protein